MPVPRSLENRPCYENRIMGINPFLAWHWLCPSHACPLQGEKEVTSPLPFPSSPHPQEATVAIALSDARGCGGAKAEHLAACLRISKMCPEHLYSGIRTIWSGSYHRDEFMPVFIFSGIFWCPYSVKVFMSVIFPALRKILVDRCVIQTVNWGLLPCTQ